MRPLPALTLTLALTLIACGCSAPESAEAVDRPDGSVAGAPTTAASTTAPRAATVTTPSKPTSKGRREISRHDAAVSISSDGPAMRSRQAASTVPPSERPPRTPAAAKPLGPMLEEPPLDTTRAGVVTAPPAPDADAPAADATTTNADAAPEPAAPERVSTEPNPAPEVADPAPAAVEEPITRAAEFEPLPAGAPPQLDVSRGLTRPNGPIEVRVRAAESHGALALQVLDRTGRLLETVTVAPGTVDLLPLAPELATAHETVWVQLVEEGRAVGAPLWITPLRAAPPVRTVRSIRPGTQQPYQRVVGWGDRAIDPNDAETAAALPGWTPADPVVTAGFRVEPAVECVLHTSDGAIRIGFAPDAAPATVENFLRLVRGGFYDGTVFHRVVPLDREGRAFVVQGGDPTGTGDGGPGWNLALEPSDLRHERGVLGMARGDDPHSAGSQFYISLGREGTARLDGQYCTFAFMLDGVDALDRIAQSEIGDTATGRPRTPPRIERAELVAARPCNAGSDPHGRITIAEPAPPVRPSPTGER